MPQAEITAKRLPMTLRLGPYTSSGSAFLDAEGDHICLLISVDLLTDVEDYLMLRGWFRESQPAGSRVVRMQQMTYGQWLAFYPSGYRQYRELVETDWNQRWPKRCVCPENNCDGDGSTGRTVRQPFPNTSVPEHCPCDGHCEYLPDHPQGADWRL